MIELVHAVSAHARIADAHGSGERAVREVEVRFVVGEPACGLAGWRLTHQQAQAALVVALRRPRPLTSYRDVALLAVALKDRALARALIDMYVAPLDQLRDGGAVLRKTLRAYLGTERSVSSTAAVLGVTRKTVANRLHTIEARLGRSLHPCPAELEVALLLDDLPPVSAPAETSISE
jgi:sugar diacid utilization regulator